MQYRIEENTCDPSIDLQLTRRSGAEGPDAPDEEPGEQSPDPTWKVGDDCECLIFEALTLLFLMRARATRSPNRPRQKICGRCRNPIL
jgi:hypothetical protein